MVGPRNTYITQDFGVSSRGYIMTIEDTLGKGSQKKKKIIKLTDPIYSADYAIIRSYD
jgi:hypothetical protein